MFTELRSSMGSYSRGRGVHRMGSQWRDPPPRLMLPLVVLLRRAPRWTRVAAGALVLTATVAVGVVAVLGMAGQGGPLAASPPTSSPLPPPAPSGAVEAVANPEPWPPIDSEPLLLSVDKPSVAADIAAVIDGVEVFADLGGSVTLEVPAGRERDVNEAARASGAEAVPDPRLYLASTPVLPEPNDPYWRSWYGAIRGNLRAAYGVTTGSPTVTIAVVDTGVAPMTELAGRLLPGHSVFADVPPNTDPDGHGTMAAQVAAGAVNNRWSAAGTCPGCRILPVNVFPADSSSTPSSAVAQGVEWAADNGADIINLSLGGPAPSPALQRAVNYAMAKGVVVVASAGNDGQVACSTPSSTRCATAPSYPAAYDGVLSVAASTNNGDLYSWSSRWTGVDVAAPGSNIVELPGPVSGQIVWYQGTSSAAPFVSGVLGLYLSLYPDADPAEVMAALQRTSIGPDNLIPGIWGEVAPGEFMTSAATARVVAPTVANPPAEAVSGGNLIVEGSRLDYVEVVRFGDIEVGPTSATPTSLMVTVPEGLDRGPVPVVLVGLGADSETFAVDIRYPPPVLSSLGPTVGAYPGNTVVVEGQWFPSVGATALFDDAPIPVVWRSPNRLELTLPADAVPGAHTISVVTPDGSTDPAPYLVLDPRPGVVRDVGAVVGDSGAVVSWLPPVVDGGSAVTGFVVWVDGWDVPVCEVPVGVLSCVVSGLVNGVGYSVGVGAVNAAGVGPVVSVGVVPTAPATPPQEPEVPERPESPESPESRGEPESTEVPDVPEGPEEAPTVPDAPADVVATLLAEGSNVAIVSWSEPEVDGGLPIEEYRVVAIPDGQVCVTSTTSCEIDALVYYSATTFVVQAVNAAGVSAQSMPSDPVIPRFRSVATDLGANLQLNRAVDWLVGTGIANISGSRYFPERRATRHQVVTNLWRMMDRPPAAASCGFADLNTIPRAGRTAACWAREQGLVTGRNFVPSGAFTRGHAARFLWLAAGAKATRLPCAYGDMAVIPVAHRRGACWMDGQGLVATRNFVPGRAVTRREMALFMYRLSQAPGAFGVALPSSVNVVAPATR